MNRWIACSLIALMGIPAIAAGQDNPSKVIIIKADDIRRESEKWNRFFAISREKGVKVTAGVICSTLVDGSKEYLDWLRALNASDHVELWNHGWDHKRWTTDEGVTFWEFKGTGYEHQKKHFEDSQAIMKDVLGTIPIAFGTPFNAADSDTLRVMSESTEMRLFFCYSVEGLKDKVVAPMVFRGEHDGTGKPNFATFKEDYKEKTTVSFSALQFHPNSFSEEHFNEYSRIIDFLIAEGWTFMLPTEYVAMADQLAKLSIRPNL